MQGKFQSGLDFEFAMNSTTDKYLVAYEWCMILLFCWIFLDLWIKLKTNQKMLSMEFIMHVKNVYAHYLNEIWILVTFRILTNDEFSKWSVRLCNIQLKDFQWELNILHGTLIFLDSRGLTFYCRMFHGT